MSTTKYSLGPGLGGIGEGNLALKAVANFETGGTVLDSILSNPNSPCYVQEAYLANGWTTLSVPNPASLANCAGVLIIPPFNNVAIAVKLRQGAGADSGITLSKFAPTLLTFDSTPPASIDVNWAGRNYQNTTVTLDGAANTVTLTAHALIQDEMFKLVSAGSLPVELSLNTGYFVTATIAANTFQIANVKGGAAVDFTGNGTGTIKLSTLNNFKFFWF